MWRALFGATIAGGFGVSVSFSDKSKMSRFPQAVSRSDRMLRQPLEGGFRFLRPARFGGACGE
jgi:hypothetical protein